MNQIMQLWQVVMVAVIAGAVTLDLQRRFRMSNVEASAWVAILSGLLLPLMFADGYRMAGAATCVSYAAMSSQTWIRNQGQMVKVSVICALVFHWGYLLLPGLGGRLGTFGAFSVVAVVGLHHLWEAVGHQVRVVAAQESISGEGEGSSLQVPN